MNKLKNNTEKAYKYKWEKLDCDSVEHKIVKDFYDTTTFTSIRSLPDLPPVYYNVYKIVESNPTKNFKEKQNNLMLFHGTSSKGVKGILTEGFKNSTKGWFGKGVYMTDCSYIARSYCFGMDGFNYVFVSEVLKSDKLQTFKYGRYDNMSGKLCDHDYKPKHLFEKHIFEGSQKLTEKDYKKDDQGRKYRNIKVKDKSADDEYVADENLVVPRYLIVFGPKPKFLTPKFLNKFKVQESDFELKKSKPLNLEVEQIKEEFTNLYHEIIKKESWYVEYKKYEDKLLETFSQQIDIEDLNPDHEHYEDFMMRLVIMMKLVKTHIK